MNKLALAALVTGTIGGVGTLVYTSTRNDAHASSRAEATALPSAAAAHASNAAPGEAHPAKSCGSLSHVLAALGHHAPALPSSSDNESPTAKTDNDCAAVGRHLAELEADTTHGPTNRPDDDEQASCASHYVSACESEAWSAERRNCTLEAADMINAHLCAAGGHAPTASSGSADSSAPLPANLACPALGAHLASVVQGEGFHADVKDLPEQLAAACDVGAWATDLRTCFAAAASVDALQACLGNDAHLTK